MKQLTILKVEIKREELFSLSFIISFLSHFCHIFVTSHLSLIYHLISITYFLSIFLDAVKVTQFTSNYFISMARMNLHSFDDSDQGW